MPDHDKDCHLGDNWKQCPACLETDMRAQPRREPRQEPASKRITELERVLSTVRSILAGPASNSRFMQIAEPARRCINHINKVLP